MTAHHIRRMRIWLPVLAVLAALSLQPEPVNAHARLQESDPVDGSALTSLPGTINLVFTEPVDPDQIAVSLYGPDSAARLLDRPTVAADHRSLALDIDQSGPELPGTYTFVWAVTSESDGHDSTGAVLFTVGTGRPPVGAEADNPRAPIWQIALRAFWLGVIGLLSAALIAPEIRRSRQWIWGLAGALGAGCALALANGSDLRVRADQMQLVAGLLTLLTGVAIWQLALRPGSRLLVAGLVISVTILLASSGHPAGMDRRTVAVAIGALHMLVALTWFGWLVALSIAARNGRSPHYANRLSTAATTGLATVITTGLLSAALLIPGQRAGLGSPYGLTLIIKVLIVILVLVIAATNRWIVPKWRTIDAIPPDRQATWLIIAETGLLAVTIILAATLSGTAPPARYATVLSAAPVHSVDQHTQTGRFDVALTAAIAGTVDDRFTIHVAPISGPEPDIQRLIVETSTILADGTTVTDRFDADPVPGNLSQFTFPATRLTLTSIWTVSTIVREAGTEDSIAAFTIDTTTWIAPPPETVERSWSLPIVPAGAWALLALALLVAIGGLAMVRRQPRVAPVSGAIIILALAMIATGFVIQAIQRSPPRTSGHDLTMPEETDPVQAGADFDLLCVACHGVDGAGLDTVDPNHQHGSGTNLIDGPSRTLSDGDLFTLISDGVAGTDMPSYSLALTDEQRWGLVAYLRSLQVVDEDRTGD